MPAAPLPSLSPRASAALGARAGPVPPMLARRSMQAVMLHVASVDAGLLERVWTNADDLVGSGTMLKDGDRCTVVRIDVGISRGKGDVAHSEQPRHFMLKRYNLKGQFHTATHIPLRSRARWSWLNGRRLIQAGVATPMPLACVEERLHGVMRLRSYLLTEFVPGRSLLDLVQSGDAKGEQLADFAKQFTRIWQALGQLRAGHGDMKASNFVVDPHGKLWLIDLDGLRIHRSGFLLRRERRMDLARFMRNWQEKPEVAAVFRARIGTG